MILRYDSTSNSISVRLVFDTSKIVYIHFFFLNILFYILYVIISRVICHFKNVKRLQYLLNILKTQTKCWQQTDKQPTKTKQNKRNKLSLVLV